MFLVPARFIFGRRLSFLIMCYSNVCTIKNQQALYPSSPQLCIEDIVFGLVFVNYKLTCESPIEVPYYVAFADPLFFFLWK